MENRALVRTLLDREGRTYAEEAGIKLADRPAPLYQLLVLTTLLSTRIRAGVAMAAARELFAAGGDTPQGMDRLGWQRRVDALGRGHYRRYDERTATMLGNGARLCMERWQGDLRRLHRAADADVKRLRELLMEFPGVGPTGADIFLREVQAVWPDLRPYIDKRVAAGAQRVHLPASPDQLARLAGSDDFPRLVSALVRVSLDQKLADQLVPASRSRR
jgi:endonuclease III